MPCTLPKDCETNPDCWKATYLPLCMKPAIAGPPPPDQQLPTIPPTTYCEHNWEYLPASGKCYYFDGADRTWAAAKDNCAGLGGDLASLNSPDLNQELFTLAWLDVTALGTRKVYPI